jgi:hypothetical protein
MATGFTYACFHMFSEWQVSILVSLDVSESSWIIVELHFSLHFQNFHAVLLMLRFWYLALM